MIWSIDKGVSFSLEIEQLNFGNGYCVKIWSLRLFIVYLQSSSTFSTKIKSNLYFLLTKDQICFLFSNIFSLVFICIFVLLSFFLQKRSNRIWMFVIDVYLQFCGISALFVDATFFSFKLLGLKVNKGFHVSVI